MATAAHACGWKDQTMRIGVIGPDTLHADAEDLRLAEHVGRLLGQAGATIVCGGTGGVMEAACRGAREHGATTVGLLPGWDAAYANPHVTVALPLGVGEMRNTLIVNASEAIISIGGSWGTLSEIALALRTGTPCVILRGWRIDTHGHDTEATPLPVDDPVTAVREAISAAGRGRRSSGGTQPA